MNFFRRQTEVRALSRRLVWLFVLAILIIVCAVDAVLLVVWALLTHQNSINMPAIFWSSVLVLSVMAGASFYKTLILAAGGDVVARAAGGERVLRSAADTQQRRLLNVVEEMAIASGVPVPAVYVLPRETGINAFAAGLNPSNAAIAVTRGTLEMLDRTELQAVVAHEFSHIVNGDMRLNVQLMGFLFGLTVIAMMARIVMRVLTRSRGDSRSGIAIGVVLLAALCIYVLGYIGLFFGRLIQAAVARQRESLADAAAVQFTRDTTGLRNALVKIGANVTGSKLVDADAEEIAHFLFAPGMQRMFATHPPLEARIKAIDPSFKVTEFAKMRTQMLAKLEAKQIAAEAESLPAATATQRLQRVLGAAVSIGTGQVAQSVGQPTAQQIELAQAIRVSLPEKILTATDQPAAAQAVLLCLALDQEPNLQQQQLKFIETQLGAALAAQCEAWRGEVEQLNAMQRQPVLMRLLPSLRQLSSDERRALLMCINGLLQRGGRMSLQQYALRKLAQVQLYDLVAPGHASRLTLTAVRQESTLLLAALAHFGHMDETQAKRAYAQGVQLLDARGAAKAEYHLPDNWPVQLDAALTRLDHLLPAAKEILLEAMVRVIQHDGQLTANEAELLRVTAAALHCPLPPFLGDH